MAYEELAYEEEELKEFHYTVECINVSKTIRPLLIRKKEVLKNITLNISPGVFFIVGPRGSGVSTLLKILAGIIQPTTGTVRVLGYDLKSEGLKAKRRIGYVPQRIYVSAETFGTATTGREFLISMGKARWMTPFDAEEKALIVAKRFNITRYLDVSLDKYTDSMKHLLLLGAAIIHEPDVLILDEPFINYDPRTVHYFLDVINQYRSEKKTVIIGTSYLPDALFYGDALAILVDGVLVYYGDKSRLARRVDFNKFRIGVSELDIVLEAIRQEEVVLEAYIERRSRAAQKGARGMLNRGVIAVTVSDYKVFWKKFREISHQYGSVVFNFDTIPPLRHIFAKELERMKIAGPLIAQREKVVKAAWEAMASGDLLKAAKLFNVAAEISARLGEEDKESEYRKEADYLEKKGRERHKAYLIEKKGIVEDEAEMLLRAGKYEEAAKNYDIAAEIAYELGNEEEAMRLRVLAAELREKIGASFEKRRHEFEIEELKKKHTSLEARAKKALERGDYFDAAFFFERAAEVADQFDSELAKLDRSNAEEIKSAVSSNLPSIANELISKLLTRARNAEASKDLETAMYSYMEAAEIAEAIGASDYASQYRSLAETYKRKLESLEHAKQKAKLELKIKEIENEIRELRKNHLYAEAAEKYRTLADLVAPYDPDKAEVYLRYADRMLELQREYEIEKKRKKREKELTEMLDEFLKSAKEYEAAGDYGNAYQMWFRVAEILSLLGQKEKAQKAEQHAEALRKRWETLTTKISAEKTTKDLRSQLESLVSEAEAAYKAGEYGLAAEKFEGAYLVASMMGDQKLMAIYSSKAKEARAKEIAALRAKEEEAIKKERIRLEKKTISREEKLRQEMERLLAEAKAEKDLLAASEKYSKAADIALELGEIDKSAEYRKIAFEMLRKYKKAGS